MYEKSITLIGRCLLEVGDYSAAGNYLEKAVSLRPTCKVAYLSLGDLAVKNGQYSEAISYLNLAESGVFESFSSFDEVSVDYSVQFFIGQSLSSLGDQVGAAQAFKLANTIAPRRTEAKQALSMLEIGVTAKDKGLYVKPTKTTNTDRSAGKKSQSCLSRQTLSLCMTCRVSTNTYICSRSRINSW